MPDSDRDQDDVARAAIAWHVRLKDGSASAQDRAAFERWVAARAEHRRAYEEAQALWRRVGPAAEILGAGGWHRRMSAPRRAAFLHAALAAFIAAFVVAGALWWRDPGLIDRTLADYATGRGEHRELTLSDGSRVYLDGDSAIKVSLSSADRYIKLLRGRAWFDVAHDDAAPFRVAAGTVETRDIGTAFAVERDSDRVTVTVERGRVSVADGQAAPVDLGAGQSISIRHGAPASPENVDTETALAWHRGLLVFDRAALGTVVDELDRMRPGRVLVAGAGLRQRMLSGVFRTDDPDAVLAALRSGLGVKTTTIPGVVTLIHP